MSDGVSNKDIYDAINDLRKEIMHRVEVIEAEVHETTNWRNKVIGQITVIFAVIGIVANWGWDLLTHHK